MKKILIIGSPGTGKSTLSRKLESRMGLPVVHLDKYWHDSALWDVDITKKKLQWRKHIKKLAKRRAWIMDGNFTSTLDIRVPEADLVIFLDYSTTTALCGVIKRRITRSNQGDRRPDMPSDWQEQRHMFLGLLKKVVGFRRMQKPRIVALLQAKPKEQVLIFKNRRELRKYMQK